MLTVSLVASLSATAYWWQWRAWAVEQAEQQQAQSAWLLVGALDWARLILREDARASAIDHLAEPWALPLREARLSSFIAAGHNAPDAWLTEAFLSGEIADEQAKLNMRNLLAGEGTGATLSRDDATSARRLFDQLGLPSAELDRLLERLPQVSGEGPLRPDLPAPLPPTRFMDLVGLGLSEATVRALEPYATWLPERTALNLNTASALAIHATTGLHLSQALRWVEQRQQRPFASAAEVLERMGMAPGSLATDRLTVVSRYFRVSGQLRLDTLRVEETSLVVRDGLNVRVLWRVRGLRTAGQPLS
jgi:general secretion pathway protein K